MKDVIKLIKSDVSVDALFKYVIANLYRNGPTSITDMEILSHLACFRPVEFEQYKVAILNYMAVFYKPTETNSLEEVIFTQYRKYIQDTFHDKYTPVQADIIKGIAGHKCFSFSAPTSTGKSYVFMKQISQSTNDVVVVVPSRALINEYYLTLSQGIQDKSVNILTFIDKINTKHSKKNIFIVTPERCRELFKLKNEFHIGLFLFDEAQLSSEESKRGLYFDSIVRRCMKAFEDAIFVFAHPFVKNPESQIEKNHFDPRSSRSIQYVQKNVGQMFMCHDGPGKFHHFGVNTEIMGKTKVLSNFDPLERVLSNGGSVLIYIPKSKILNGKFLVEFQRYVDLCPVLPTAQAATYLQALKEYTGGETEINNEHYSQMLDLLKRGIVIHHGSLPLQTRLIIEQFTKDGFCRICFATSTLEQGINMPFDLVYLDRLEGSKPLAVKNLIGRAGRSSREPKFDYGFVVVNSPQRMSTFRGIMLQDEILDNVSALEKDDQHDEEYNDFKQAILEGTYSDEFNLTEKDLEKLSTDSIDGIIELILNAVFINGELISLEKISRDLDFRLSFYAYFRDLYSLFLSRPLEDGENSVLNTAIKIIFWRVYGKTFKQICWYRYSYASKSHERRTLRKSPELANQLPAAFVMGYHDLPNKNLYSFSLLQKGTKAADVSYDLIMYDTYDYIDKLIGFKLSDIFYAAFTRYAEKYDDPRGVKLAMYIKFGTDNDRTIWMLRYGMSFEDIEVLSEHIESINEEQIVFANSIETVPEDQKASVIRFIRND
ncbi:DEAD/DEAH box helicase [Pedobacter panaciterrae]|uniref:DEAD/DEAH box helicase n=1 Tax=Pedobacter panaciterrae TaxID=363849 RepID=A0ABU8NHE0_9SPHI